MISHNFFLISQIGHEATLWFLLFLSIVGLAIALERFFFLRSWKKSIHLVKDEVQQSIETYRLHWLEQFHNHFSHLDPDPGTQIMSQYLKENPSLIKEVSHSFILSTKIQLEARLNILASIGTNAPFIGLLGTIFGVMDAFYSLGMADESTASIVMLGISKALLATAIGLLVAIPAIVSYNFLKRRIRLLLDDMEYIRSGMILYVQSLEQEPSPSDEKSSKKTNNPLDKKVQF